jgi:hypothetical protein
MADPKADDKAHLSDPLQGNPPQLARALLEAKAGTYDAWKTKLEKAVTAAQSPRARIDLQSKDTFDKDLADLLGHVEERIKNGLDEPWLSDQGYAWRPPPEFKNFQSKDEFEKAQQSQAQFQGNLLRLYNDPEEKWSRALTETFVFLMYGGPDVMYSKPTPTGVVLHNSDIYSPQYFPNVYPLAVACQHLSTFAVLSRGKSQSDVGGDGLNCNGDSATLPAFKKGMKFTSKGQCGTTSCILDHVGPGDAVFFNFHGPDSHDQKPVVSAEDKKNKITASGTVHSGTVLRTWGKHLQYIDTGVLTSTGVPGATEGGTTDHEWAAENLGQYGDAVGIGAMGDKPSNLGELADKLSKARPLAIARLVIMDEKSKSFPAPKGGTYTRSYRVRYASRLLHLWLGDGGIPLSKLIWSIRDPPTNGVRLAWWVYLPKGDWVKKFVPQSATSSPVSTLLTPKGDLDSLYNCNILLGLGDGKVAVLRRFERTTKDGPSSGWSRDFGKDVSVTADMVPWIDAGSFEEWSVRKKSYGEAYRFVDPAGTSGEEYHDKVGVGLFDQGL